MLPTGSPPPFAFVDTGDIYQIPAYRSQSQSIPLLTTRTIEGEGYLYPSYDPIQRPVVIQQTTAPTSVVAVQPQPVQFVQSVQPVQSIRTVQVPTQMVVRKAAFQKFFLVIIYFIELSGSRRSARYFSSTED